MHLRGAKLKRHIRNICFTLVTFAITAHTWAEEPFSTDFVNKFPFAQGANIQPAFKGFHSVVKGQEIFFVSDDMSVLIKGDVFDLSTQTNLTKKLSFQSMPKLPADALEKLDVRNAIKYGNGKHPVYVFSDPDCPYCKKFQSEIPKLKDATVYIFPYPLSELHPGAFDAATNIWCSADKAKAWDDYVTKKIPAPQANKCLTPMAVNKAFGDKYGIVGTPTIILSDRRMFPGMIAAQDLNAEIQVQK